MDVVYGWEEEEKRVGSNFAACMWIYTKEALTSSQISTPQTEEYLKQRLMSIMLCMNWVCVGTFDDYELVSVSTIHQCEEEMMGMELDHGSLHQTRLNRIREQQGTNIAKYHETVKTGCVSG